VHEDDALTQFALVLRHRAELRATIESVSTYTSFVVADAFELTWKETAIV
jgi:hypothetical protein